jgi:hypothetical protein
MRAIGCLGLIVVIGVVIYLVITTQDMTAEEKGQFIGEKAHRGWNRVKRLTDSAREGWKSAQEEGGPPPDGPP